MTFLHNIHKKYKDYWIFDLFFPWGDLAIACSLIHDFKAKKGGKVLVLVHTKGRADVARLFPSIDEVLVVPSDVYDYMYSNPCLKIKRGHFFEINHWKFYNAPRYKSKNFLELYAHMLELSSPINIEHPIISEKVKKIALEEIKHRNIDVTKTVLFCPISNSYNCTLINQNFWLNLAQEYTKKGFKVLFNTPNKSYGKYDTIYLPMDVSLYFCSLLTQVVAIRSGFNDLLTIYNGGKNLRIFYPKNMFFRTITPLMQLLEFKRAFLDETEKNFNENMFRICSLKMFGNSHIIEEIIN